jgi:RHS repeat-associated protein
VVREVADASGRAVWLWGGEPFGASLPDENPSGLGQVSNHSRFPGQYFDAGSGLNYNIHRDYDVVSGRYIQSDPIGLYGGTNTYLYANGNPYVHSDSLGLSWEQGGALLGCGIGGGVGSTLGAAGGASLGATAGLACGPGAPACSTAGAVGLGTAGWIAGGAAGCAGGGAIGGAIGKVVDMCTDDDLEDRCDKQYERENLLCEIHAGGRYYGGRNEAVTVCRRAALVRYSFCLKGIPESDWPPLTGVDTEI